MLPSVRGNPDVRPDPSPWGSARGWLLLAVLLAFELAMFRQFVLSELSWAIPLYADQTAYLSQSYEGYERMRGQGLLGGLGVTLGTEVESGMLVQVEASLLFLVLGPGRLTALLLNFLHFALLQIVLARTLLWLTRRWSVAFLGVGLLLTAQTSYGLVGGLFDFRLDFIACCLFGIFTCLLARSEMFAVRRWAVAAGVVGGVCVLSRFLTAVYFAGIFSLAFAVLCLQWLLARDRAARGAKWSRLGNFILAGLVLLAVCAPGLWVNRHGLRHHYVDHVNGAENVVRQQQFHTQGTLDRLLFYPLSIWQDHTGGTLWLVGGVGVVVAALAGFVRWYRSPAGQKAAPGGAPSWAGLYAGVVCVLVPVLALTAYPSPSPVVGSVVTGSLVLTLVAAMALLGRTQRTASRASPVLALVALAALSAGLWAFTDHLVRRTVVSNSRQDLDSLAGVLDAIGRHSQRFGWQSPRVSSDTIADYLFPSSITASVYERQGILLHPQPRLGEHVQQEVSEGGAVALLADSDFVVLQPTPAEDQQFFPFNRCMAELRPRLLEYCNRSLILLDRFRFSGRDLLLYVRPQLEVEGDSGSWITSSGLALIDTTGALQHCAAVELRGKADSVLDWHGQAPGVRAVLLSPGMTPRPIPATLAVTSTAYQLRVEFPEQDLPVGREARVQLLFDHWFIPREIGLNSDTRQLVIPTPEQVVFHPR
jgi:hypothetical protein